ncbi:MarR family winged helix-turn-helix transcriptional regulator [Celeribacter ethanolicus]|uniref:MarR family winged helix-turn-helix transcriptional regulator n=1 Tax=Celeribacter ethanolicus TaxID=1758178 RepID=UPI000835AF6C|nr:winged helix-turn-helix transcriptional regulator [Celeribacter ethanolicus]TNE63166.1 MAG: winged helix-turn-helix transcriptional regulator [Paracoccaceae bacterium]
MSEPTIVTERNLSVRAETYAPYFLSLINNRLSWGASQLYLSLFDLGLNEWRILSALRNEPGIQALRVSEMVSMNKSVVSRSTRKLEEEGLAVARLVMGKRLLWLTDEGAKVHDEIIEIAYRREAALLDGFDDKDREMLFALLQRLADNLPKVEQLDQSLLHEPARR